MQSAVQDMTFASSKLKCLFLRACQWGLRHSLLGELSGSVDRHALPEGCETVDDVDHNWANSEKRPWNCEAEFFLVSDGGSQLNSVVGEDAQKMGVAGRFNSLGEVPTSENISTKNRTVIVIDIDIFSETEMAIEALLSFRANFPSTPLVIASRKFSRNDFSHERAPIADASLKLPAARSDLALAIESARANASTRIQ